MRWTPGICVIVLLGGCGGGDVCKIQARQLEDCGIEVPDSDIEACEEDLEPCTAAEERDLATYIQCTEDEGLTYCDEPDDAVVLSAVLACAKHVDDISQECLGFNIEPQNTGPYTQPSSR